MNFFKKLFAKSQKPATSQKAQGKAMSLQERLAESIERQFPSLETELIGENEVHYKGALGEGRMFTDNLSRRIRQSKTADTQSIIDEFVRPSIEAALSSGSNHDVDPIERLRPILRQELHLPPNIPLKMTSREFVPGIFEYYVLDDAKTTQQLDETTRAQFGWELDYLRGKAIDNLALCARGHNKITAHSIGSSSIIYQVSLDGYYEASMILVEAFIDHIEKSAKEEIRVAIPATDIFMFCKASDKPALAQMRSIAEEAYGQREKPITPDLLKIEDGKWQFDRDAFVH